MTEEEKKARYKNIVYRLKIINNKINDLNSSISGLKYTIKRSITINDTTFKEDTIDNINSNLKDTSESIKDNIIPSINRKIYN